MMLGIAVRIMGGKGELKIENGCFATNVWFSKPGHWIEHKLTKTLFLTMQTSFTFWSVQFFKLSDPSSEGTCISIDLALLIHLWLNLSIPFSHNGSQMTITLSYHNSSNIYTAFRQFLNELFPETLRNRFGLLTPFVDRKEVIGLMLPGKLLDSSFYCFTWK